MSQSTRARKGPEAPQQSSPLGALAAVAVVALFVVLGLMLARPAAQPTAGEATPLPFEAVTPAPAEATAAPAPTAEAAAAAGDVAARNNRYSAPPPMTIDVNKRYTATITTPRGDIVIRLRPDLAPQTVNSFVFLAREGFYDGTTWHRVLENFMAQGGDPTGTGMGGPGYTIQHEAGNGIPFDRAGLLSMAHAMRPNTTGSQFFITYAPTPNLNADFTVFGEVIEGMDVVEGLTPRDPQADPNAPPGDRIATIRVVER